MESRTTTRRESECVRENPQFHHNYNNDWRRRRRRPLSEFLPSFADALKKNVVRNRTKMSISGFSRFFSFFFRLFWIFSTLFSLSLFSILEPSVWNAFFHDFFCQFALEENHEVIELKILSLFLFLSLPSTKEKRCKRLKNVNKKIRNNF